MKKIAILTVVDYNNYGNRLQNYALQKVLESEGYEVQTLKNSFVKTESKIDQLKLFVKRNLLASKFGTVFMKYEKKQRISNFMEFTKKYISESNFDISNPNVSTKELAKFDTIIVGSDQIWNYELLRFSELNFFPFKQPRQKLVSYAASFGVDKIPVEKEDMFVKGLQEFDNITVREEAGSRIVSQLLERDAKVVLDPTMLLSKSDWSSLADESDLDTDYDYLVTYFLGEPTKEQKEYINGYARKYNLKIRKFNDITDTECYKLGPAGFVKLIRDSKGVFADSFHASVFSIIFEKFFKVFERNSNHQTMISRIDTLLSLFDLETQRFSISDYSYDDIDYDKVDVILQHKRQASMNYLLKMLQDK